MATKDEIEAILRNAKIEGHTRHMGMRFVASGDNWSEYALDHRPELAISKSDGVFASGPIISLIDHASGVAIFVTLRRYRPAATLDLRIDYLRAAPPGKTIVARATCYRMTKNVAFVSCEAHDGDPGDPVARSQASFFFMGD
jgi:uncharacterized protein (TIGR00369 family)